MNREELAEKGLELADNIKKIIYQYHVKSDDYTILEWEIDILEAKAKDLSDHCGLQQNLNDSTLINPWGKSLANKYPELSREIDEFHKSYERSKNVGINN